MGAGDLSDVARKDPELAKKRLMDAKAKAEAAAKVKAAAGKDSEKSKSETSPPRFAAGLKSDFGAAAKDGDRPASGADSPESDTKTGDQDDDQEPRKFPLWCLPPVLGDMAKAISDSIRVPLELAGPIVLATVSGAIGKGLKTKSGPNLHVYGNLYMIGFAESGSGKSNCFKPATEPIRNYESELQSYWEEITRPELEAEKRILEKEISNLERKIKKAGFDRAEIKKELTDKLGALHALKAKFGEPRIITEDTTEEALGLRLYENNEQIFSLSPDAGKALQNLEGRYSNDNNPEDNLYVKGRSGDHHTVDRIGRDSLRLKEPIIALFWLTQPAKVVRMLSNKDLSTGGFLPRCFLFDTRSEPNDQPDEERPIPPQTRENYHALLKSLMDTYRGATEPMSIPGSPEVARLIRWFHNRLVARRKTDLRDINSFIARWHENVWCMTVVLHAAQHGALAHTVLINKEAAANAIAIVEWFGEEQIRALSTMRYKADCQKVQALITLINDRYDGQATMRDLTLRNNWKKEEVDRLAKKFPRLLAVETKLAGENGGRPSQIVKTV